MNKLIKGAAFAVCAGAMLVFTGCGGGDSPESVVKRELDGWIKANDPGDNTMSSKITKCEVNGDSAVVSFVVAIKGEGDSPEEKRELKKVNGKWINPKNTLEYWSLELIRGKLKGENVKGNITIKFDPEEMQRVESLELENGNHGYGVKVTAIVDGKVYRKADIMARWEGGSWEKSSVLWL